ncbi:phage tail fiber protein [Morganella morganii]|uniref:phage tail fiber protein n=1 Tax=Morganella morganii TaxID=582 RepID=UPI003B251B9A
MIEVSATGLALVVKASKTFPSGILITAFADDADPLDFQPTEIVKTGVDINGNLLSWSAPAPQTVTINVPAGSEEDQNLAILLDANTAKRGRRAAGDNITMVASYGNGSTTTARNGRITNGSRGSSVSSVGRLKSKQYIFVFQDFDFTRNR